jgi:predicted SAM-dependent methyltransferase
MKLHLGCGTKRIDGYHNIDIRYLPGVDEVNNVKFLRNYKLNTVDEIYASHVLEHFGRWEYKHVLKRWFDILKPGGALRIAVPDFESITEYYNETKDLNPLIGMMYGGQDYDENFHHIIFDFNTLSKDLYDLGFINVTKWDTMEMQIDDFSKSFLPHMDFKNGKLMSLNILAIK